MTSAALHLLAAGVWLGGLPLLAMLLTWAQRADHASAERIAAEATRRFSALGLGSVLLLVVTGVYNTWTLVGTIPALIGTPYGQLLLVKLGLLLPLLGLAIVNLRYLKPRLVRVVAVQQRRQTRETLRRLRRCVLGEAVLGVAILLIVGALGSTPPARHVPPTWPFPFRLNWEVTWDLPGVWSRMLLGGQVALVGLLALGYAVLGRYWRGLVAGLGVAGLLAGLYVVCQAMAIDAYPTTYLTPSGTLPGPVHCQRAPTSTRSIAPSVMGWRATETVQQPRRSTHDRPTSRPNIPPTIPLATSSGGSLMG